MASDSVTMTLDYEIPDEWASDPREARAYVAGVNMALTALCSRAEGARAVEDAARALLKNWPNAWSHEDVALAAALRALDDSWRVAKRERDDALSRCAEERLRRGAKP